MIDYEIFSEGIQALLLAVPGIRNEVSRFEGVDGDIPAIFRGEAPQEARAPFIEWNRVDGPPTYSSCGEIDHYRWTLQVDVVGVADDSLDVLATLLHQSLSDASGLFGDLNLGALVVEDVRDDTRADVETEGGFRNPVKQFIMDVFFSTGGLIPANSPLTNPAPSTSSTSPPLSGPEQDLAARVADLEEKTDGLINSITPLDYYNLAKNN